MAEENNNTVDKENSKKPVYKRVWFWVIIVIVVLVIIACASSGSDEEVEETVITSEGETVEVDEVEELHVGDTWTVDGQWTLTITSVKSTDDRNQFSDKTPAQVVYVTYTYENLGYEDSWEIMDGLYIDLEPNSDAIVVDGEGEMAYSYPDSITQYPVETPVGAKCVDAQVCIGLNNVSDTIKMTIKKYGGDDQSYEVTYMLDID